MPQQQAGKPWQGFHPLNAADKIPAGIPEWNAVGKQSG